MKNLYYRSIVNTLIFVEWNDNPKLVSVDNEMPKELQSLWDDWLSTLEYEENNK